MRRYLSGKGRNGLWRLIELPFVVAVGVVEGEALSASEMQMTSPVDGVFWLSGPGRPCPAPAAVVLQLKHSY